MSEDRLTRNRALVDRLIGSVVDRAGSEDTGIIVAEFIESFETDEDKILELMFLVLTAIERAADLSTPVDIWDPERRIDPVKATRLGLQTQAAFADLARELKKEATHGQ